MVPSASSYFSGQKARNRSEPTAARKTVVLSSCSEFLPSLMAVCDSDLARARRQVGVPQSPPYKYPFNLILTRLSDYVPSRNHFALGPKYPVSRSAPTAPTVDRFRFARTIPDSIRPLSSCQRYRCRCAALCMDDPGSRRGSKGGGFEAGRTSRQTPGPHWERPAAARRPGTRTNCPPRRVQARSYGE